MIKCLLALLPLLTLSVGCAEGTSFFSTPTAQIKSMKVDDVSAEGFTMNFGVAVTNPNQYQLPVSSADYKLSVAGVGVVNDIANTSSAIPAQGTSTVTLPVHVKFLDLVKAKTALAGSGGDVPYDVEAGVDFNAQGLSNMLGTRAVRVPLKYTGTLHLRQLLEDNFNTVSKSTAAQDILGALMSGKLDSLLGH